MRRAILTAIAVLLLMPAAEAKEWFYYTLDSLHVDLALCDSLVTINLDTSGAKEPASPEELMVPGLQQGYVPVPMNYGYWQYGVVPGYDIDTLLTALRAHPQVEAATPAFQLTDIHVWNVYNELLVTFREEVTRSQIDSVVAANWLEVRRQPSELQPSYTFLQTENSPVDIFDLCAEIFESGICQTSYPNLHGIPDLCLEPNDTYYARQWHLNHDADYPGKVDADIDMAEAWEYAGANHDNTVIAIIDWAFDLDHIDSDPSRIWFPFDAGGTSYKQRTPDFDPRLPPPPLCYLPKMWHGTALMGIVAAMTNNGQGVCGIADSIRIMPIKACDDGGLGDYETYAIPFQVANYLMVDVVLSAVEFPIYHPDMVAAIEYGYKYGGTANIVAAGNNSKRPRFLASLPTTLAVGGSDNFDNLWPRSNLGPGIDIVAPAVGITTTDVTGSVGYNPFNQDADSCEIDLDYYCNFGSGKTEFTEEISVYHGTSAAAAQVAAVAGLVKARRPDLTDNPRSPEPLYNVLRFSAEDRVHASDPAGYDTLFGWGRLSAERALLAVVRGDANNDANVNISDAVYLIAYIFGDGPLPQPRVLTGDADGNGITNISDAVYIIAYIFGGGPPPKISFNYGNL